jgi:gas vesicle protein
MSDMTEAVDALFPRPGRELWVGLALGLLAGAVAAALAAPRSGTSTRELLRERGLELKDRADELLRRRADGSPL